MTGADPGDGLGLQGLDASGIRTPGLANAVAELTSPTLGHEKGISLNGSAHFLSLDEIKMALLKSGGKIFSLCLAYSFFELL